MISCRSVAKSFGAHFANEDIDLDIGRGLIHALVGENGAGKSTLLGMISGRLAPDAGTISVAGRPIPAGRPADIRQSGVSAIYQELTMIPALSAVDNVFLGQPISRAGIRNVDAMEQRFLELCEQFEVQIDPGAAARTLPISQQQVLEIMRVVQAKSRVILMDEPTAALAEQERAALFRIIRGLNADGATIVIVSHNLDEVLELSDVVSVMRNGKMVKTARTAQWSRQALIDAMIGEDRGAVSSRESRGKAGQLLFSCSNVETRSSTVPISLELREGEVLGLWGLVGSGRTSFLQSLAGFFPGIEGTLTLAGETFGVPGSVREALKRGIVHLPENRKSALSLGMSTIDNLNSGRPRRSRFGWINRKAEYEAAVRSVREFNLSPDKLFDPIGSLSGGNQQKALLAKWSSREPRLLLVDEPTRGIDVGAKPEVLRALSRLADRGVGVVVTSSELEDVLEICDRLLIFAGGSVVDELTPDDHRFNVNDVIGLGFKDVRSDR